MHKQKTINWIWNSQMNSIIKVKFRKRKLNHKASFILLEVNLLTPIHPNQIYFKNILSARASPVFESIHLKRIYSQIVDQKSLINNQIKVKQQWTIKRTLTNKLLSLPKILSINSNIILLSLVMVVLRWYRLRVVYSELLRQKLWLRFKVRIIGKISIEKTFLNPFLKSKNKKVLWT